MKNEENNSHGAHKAHGEEYKKLCVEVYPAFAGCLCVKTNKENLTK